MKKSLPLLMLLVLFSIAAWAQTRTITGTVTAVSDQKPLPGVSIRVVGQKTGTLTNAAGKYSIQVTGTNLSLEFSYLGFKSQTKTIGSNDEVNVSLVDEETNLNEIVVTALGIKREKRTLTYSTQEVGGNALVAAKENNLVNALAGKVAGVQITNSSGAAGSSSKIVIRGNTSLTGENGALFVVDGVPINNSEAGNPDGALSAGGTANRAIDIDPNIIESVTILKGAAASALYGSAAARGVVIITTKTGKGKPSVSISSGVTVDHPIFPEFQDKYAQGSNGEYIDGNNGELGSGSWGPLIDGLTVNGVPVQKHDPRKEFFRTGFTTDNTVAVSGATDKSTYLVSYSYLKTKGTIPGTDFGRHSFFTKFSNNITDKINVIGQLNYVNTSNDRLPEGNSLASPFWTVYAAPISWDPFPTTYPDGTQRVFRAARNNPYWLVDNVKFNSLVNRFLPVFTVTYNPTPWLTITERVGADIFNDATHYHEAPGIVGGESDNGKMYNREINFRQYNHDLIIEAKKNFSDDFFGSILIGNNILASDQKTVFDKGIGLSAKDFYNISNASTQISTITESNYRKVGVYAQLTGEYKKMLSLSLTGRYDGTSVLNSDKQFYPYGSASGAFIFTEALGMNNNPIMNFGKFRISYSYVGNDNVAPYSIGTPYIKPIIGNIEFPYDNLNGFLLTNTYGDKNLKNEGLKEFETGFEFKFLKSRLNFEATYFNKVSQDLISTTPITPSSGFNAAVINAASMYNRGVEFVLGGTPIKTKDLTWDIALNFTKINNKVTEIGQGLDNIQFAGFVSPGVFAYKDQPYAVIFGSRYLRNDAGRLVIDDEGYPIIDEQLGPIGNTVPKWNAGLTTTLNYKGISLSAVLDMKKGGDVYNLDNFYLNFYGVTKVTEDRTATKVFDGVTEDGSENTKQVTLDQRYYQENFSAVDENGVEDGTYIKLRQVTLAYTFPAELLRKTPFKGLSLSATGRNLWFYTPHYTGSDPEVSLYGTGNGGGFTNFVTPSNKSFNFAVKVTF
ncbi:SusC/RagA family TonB-linked outer membrane protein [Pedobacter gandavensis]|uniref:SusC/RagA family TonB-linked outer membrane protein n=1 Tax=Pedobacter gandavensis TaxID=2679963 RepID=UPI00247A8B8E|nr:SusC/RagA family TonB-linked outer membrane protein [Pedobacter gandavensis]WGQ10186.1 SusC/RagA family TonB-linked outer membrane protein [Pedobacter gandavensis]